MTDSLQQVADDYFADLFRHKPTRATELGIHDHDSQLGDYSEDAIHTFVRQIKHHLARVDRLDASQLDRQASGDMALLRSDMQANLLWYDRLADWRRNPDFYPSLALHALYLLCIRDFAPVEQRMHSLLSRLRAMPEFLAIASDNLRAAPLLFTEVAIENAEGAVEFFQGQIPQVAKLVPALESELVAANGEALVALTNYIDFLKSDLSTKPLKRFAIGKALLQELLRVEHMVSFSVEELSDLGRQSFADTQAALVQTATSIDRGKNWPTLVAELRRHHPAADALLDAYRDEINRLHAFILDRGIVTIPSDAPLEVIATPPFARATLPYAAYIAPAPFETAQRGQFWVTPTNQASSVEAQQAHMQEHNFYNVALTAIHEAYPGHHLQLVTSNRTGSSLRKRFCSTAMVEGWAFYCEQMMVEQGYVVDKRARLFQLKDQLWRAARVVIDVGLQTGQMSVAQAMRMLTDEVYLSEDAARSEVYRYAMSPGQPMSYMLGKLEILRLRRLYEHLPLRQFHDLLLACGSVPAIIATEELAIAAQGGPPNGDTGELEA